MSGVGGQLLCVCRCVAARASPGPRNVTIPVTSSRYSPSVAAQHHDLPLNMATAHVTPSFPADYNAPEQPPLLLFAVSLAAPCRP